MPVYFMQAASGPVKIGFSQNPEQRLAMYQSGHYEDLELIRVIPGMRQTEAWLHEKFSALHIRGEWFRFDTEMTVVRPPLEYFCGEDDRARFNLTADLRRGGAKWREIGEAIGMTPQGAHNFYRVYRVKHSLIKSTPW